MGSYPALDVAGVDDHEQLLALVDDFSPSAVTNLDRLVTIYFTTSIDRDRARSALAHAWPYATTVSRDVDDEDWARRSQESLTPVTVGRIVVAPPWDVPADQGDATVIVIEPSMGFGTGHHATTRLCLAALQRIDLQDRVVLDIGTGSGVLAIAARLLGAREALGIDNDADAIQAATDNLALNPDVGAVRFEAVDLRDASLRPADIVTANLTGALLIRAAPLLRAAVQPGGTLVLSGVLAEEREAVVRALEPARLLWEDAEEGWIVLVLGI